jgi:hypothetical protein
MRLRKLTSAIDNNKCRPAIEMVIRSHRTTETKSFKELAIYYRFLAMMQQQYQV